jgi:hypothetical protein
LRVALNSACGRAVRENVSIVFEIIFKGAGVLVSRRRQAVTRLCDCLARVDHDPCHFIALNEAGETIEDLEAQDNQSKLEATLKRWMKTKIKQIEDERATAENAQVCDRLTLRSQ